MISISGARAARVMYSLLTAVLLAFPLSSLAAEPLKRIASGAATVSIQIGMQAQNKTWTLTPDSKPDVLEVPLSNGVPQEVRFITDRDAISFQVESGKSYDFIIDYDGKECFTRIVGKAYIPPTKFEVLFDYEAAQAVARLLSTGDFSDAALAQIRQLPATGAMLRKMKLKNFDEFEAYLRESANDPKTKGIAATVLGEFSKPLDGKYATLSAQVTERLKPYVPAELLARIHVYFIFGGYAGGFAFGADDVYVNLARLHNASTAEIADIVAHEVFHGVQAHVRPVTATAASDAGSPNPAAGTQWTRRFLRHLVEEGTASLFTRPPADRAATPYSTAEYATVARNAKRINGIVAMFESLAYRLNLKPPRNAAEYDRIYGLMFYTDFDETAYELGWLMMATIEKKDGKSAVFDILKNDPKHFILRYQAIATTDSSLPKFSEEFVNMVKAL